jgi:hypothetical protein
LLTLSSEGFDSSASLLANRTIWQLGGCEPDEEHHEGVASLRGLLYRRERALGLLRLPEPALVVSLDGVEI